MLLTVGLTRRTARLLLLVEFTVGPGPSGSLVMGYEPGPTTQKALDSRPSLQAPTQVSGIRSYTVPANASVYSYKPYECVWCDYAAMFPCMYPGHVPVLSRAE